MDIGPCFDSGGELMKLPWRNADEIVAVKKRARRENGRALSFVVGMRGRPCEAIIKANESDVSI